MAHIRNKCKRLFIGYYLVIPWEGVKIMSHALGSMRVYGLSNTSDTLKVVGPFFGGPFAISC